MIQVICKIKAEKGVEYVLIGYDSTVCLVQTAMKVTERKEHHTLHFLYEQSVLREAQKIINDPSHILHCD